MKLCSPTPYRREFPRLRATHIFSPSLVKMDATEENTQEVETPVVEKVKKERSILQQQVLEKARARGLEVRLEKAKDRKEAKERALQEVVEKYKKKEEEAKLEPEVEKFEPEPEVEEVAKPEPEVEKFEPPPPPPEIQKVAPPPEIQRAVEVAPPPEIQRAVEVAPPKPEFEWRNKRLTYTI
jgi:hypothetical protein